MECTLLGQTGKSRTHKLFPLQFYELKWGPCGDGVIAGAHTLAVMRDRPCGAVNNFVMEQRAREI